ncbi:MAG TPA: aminotransferase class V-fold PLP-dependent enzyme [Thermoleophilaceae bacterium]|nr:aminotransferase class V-fold PLP-dependent enzyme [Thermoleophilaceae bacterium]
MGLRSHFPVLERLAYMNAGSVGPVPREAAAAAEAELRDAVENGRGAKTQFERATELAERLRSRVAGHMGCEASELALTGATTDGVNAVLGGLDLQRGDEVLTSDEEHPGVLAPLGLERRRRGIEVRVAPFAELAGQVGPRTRLVVCSHVSWLSGRVADTAALAACEPPLLLDGAQGLGAVTTDVRELGCDYYAASGQKWLCGPVGLGYLYVRAELIEELSPTAAGYLTVTDPLRSLDLPLREGAARFDAGFPPPERSTWALAALEVLAADGLDSLCGRATALAASLAERLAARGLAVAPRGRSTLVSWEAADNEGEAKRLLDASILVRHLPGTPYLRASVGAWSNEEELERLASAAARPSVRASQTAQK